MPSKVVVVLAVVAAVAVGGAAVVFSGVLGPHASGYYDLEYTGYYLDIPDARLFYATESESRDPHNTTYYIDDEGKTDTLKLYRNYSPASGYTDEIEHRYAVTDMVDLGDYYFVTFNGLWGADALDINECRQKTISNHKGWTGQHYLYNFFHEKYYLADKGTGKLCFLFSTNCDLYDFDSGKTIESVMFSDFCFGHNKVIMRIGSVTYGNIYDYYEMKIVDGNPVYSKLFDGSVISSVEYVSDDLLVLNSNRAYFSDGRIVEIPEYHFVFGQTLYFESVGVGGDGIIDSYTISAKMLNADGSVSEKIFTKEESDSIYLESISNNIAAKLFDRSSYRYYFMNDTMILLEDNRLYTTAGIYDYNKIVLEVPSYYTRASAEIIPYEDGLDVLYGCNGHMVCKQNGSLLIYDVLTGQKRTLCENLFSHSVGNDGWSWCVTITYSDNTLTGHTVYMYPDGSIHDVPEYGRSVFTLD